MRYRIVVGQLSDTCRMWVECSMDARWLVTFAVSGLPISLLDLESWFRSGLLNLVSAYEQHWLPEGANIHMVSGQCISKVINGKQNRNTALYYCGGQMNLP